MKLIRYELPQIARFNDIDRWFDQALGNFNLGPSLYDQGRRSNRLTPAADLYEDDNNFYARIELPGVKKKEIDVKLENAVLTISGKRKSTKNKGEQNLSFNRSLSIPDGILGDKIKAAYDDGILTVTLPKVEISKPKLIEVR
jgi:HSP20 family protein